MQPLVLSRKLALVSILMLHLVGAKGLRAQFVITEGFTTEEIMHRTGYQYDTTKQLSFEQVRQSDSFEFEPNKETNFYIGYFEDHCLWLKIPILNLSQETDFVLQIATPSVDDVQFFAFDDQMGHYQMLQTGDIFPYENRDLKTKDFCFSLKVAEGETRFFYIRLDGINIPVVLWDSNEFINHQSFNEWVVSGFYGIIFFIIIIHIFFYLLLKDEKLIYYVFYVLGLGVYQISADGYTSLFFGNLAPWITNYFLPMGLLIGAANLIKFFQLYLNLKKFNSKISDIYLNFLFYFGISASFCAMLHPYLALVATYCILFYAPTVGITIILFAAYYFRQQPLVARFILFAFLVLVAGAVMIALRNLGAHIPMAEYGLRFGLISQMMVLAFALGVQLRQKEQEANNLAKERLEYLNQFRNQMFENKEYERQQMARDLHDRLGSLLSVLKIHFVMLIEHNGQQDRHREEQIHQVRYLIDQAARSIREISSELRQSPFEEHGLAEAIDALCNTFRKTGLIDIDLFINDIGMQIESQLEWEVYQIISEALNNVFKHAKANKVEVQVFKGKGRLSVSVEDNGRGFDLKKLKRDSGMGLDSIRNRAEKHGGTMLLDTQPGQGTMLMVEYPIWYEQQEEAQE